MPFLVVSTKALRQSSAAHRWTRSHPAVSTVLIGPRTPEQLEDLLASADVVLDDAVLDRIDEITEPGTDVNPDDNFDAAIPAIADKSLRRRH